MNRTGGLVGKRKFLNLGVKTVYYLNEKTSVAGLDNIYILGNLSKTILRATCAYL